MLVFRVIFRTRWINWPLSEVCCHLPCYFHPMVMRESPLWNFRPNRANYGDVLVLTKPLGTQVAVNAYQWMRDQHTFWTQTLRTVTTEDEVRRLFSAATLSMTHLNRNGKLILFHIPRGINIPDTFTSSALTCLPRDFSSSNWFSKILLFLLMLYLSLFRLSLWPGKDTGDHLVLSSFCNR